MTTSPKVHLRGFDRHMALNVVLLRLAPRSFCAWHLELFAMSYQNKATEIGLEK